ncbi:MAG: hypothetical protein M3Y87_23640, partial [Myxococcota bacterium]|nr:hypothetical protein [Myxococcota bacterium]
MIRVAVITWSIFLALAATGCADSGERPACTAPCAADGPDAAGRGRHDASVAEVDDGGVVGADADAAA